MNQSNSYPSLEAVQEPQEGLLVETTKNTPVESTTSTQDIHEQAPVAVEADEPIGFQIDVIRKQLQQEDELERPEFVGALGSAITLIVSGGLWSFLLSSKIWWLSLLYTLGNGVLPFLLWFGFSRFFFQGLRASWWLNCLIVSGFAWWFFATPFAGLLMAGVSITSFSLIDFYFRRQQEQKWEYIGLPANICKRIKSLPESLPEDVCVFLDEGLKDYNYLQEICTEPPESLPVETSALRQNAASVLDGLLTRAGRIARLVRSQQIKPADKTKQHIQEERKHVNEALKSLHQLTQSLLLHAEGQPIPSEKIAEQAKQIELLSRQKFGPSLF